MKAIATELGLDRGVVRRVLYEAGVASPPRRLTEEEISEAARRYEEGMSLARLGERYGVSAETVRIKLLDAGVQLRARRGWAPTPARVTYTTRRGPAGA